MATVNTNKPQNTQRLLDKLAKAAGLEKSEYLYLQNVLQSVNITLNNDGSIKPQANVSGRTEQLQTTLQHVAATGNFDSLGHVNDTNTDHLADGTGSPLTGGKRGFVGFDVNSRLANSFRANPVNVSNTPTSSSTLSNDGVATGIVIAASAMQFPAGLLSYNSGSVDPGGFQKSYVTASDPTFSGGAVTYNVGSTPQSQTDTEGEVPWGTITTALGVAGTGGGNTGGTKGSAGGRGYIQ